jgi:cation diffusion facilitator CzcD-associated flavoprotein CzcO
MDDRSSFYCVIGAGPVGLSVANALARAGIGYEQLEADADLGGNWRHGVYSSAHIISSRKTTEYADYPMPADYPDFPSAEQMRAYLADYADHFDLRRHIQFNTRVEFCRPLHDHRWEVELANGERRIYRGVLVCNGHHWDTRWPSYPGEFTGEYIHSKQYTNPDQLRDKRVLVIGGGNSACDVASEAARVGRSAAISIRHGYWFLPKTLLGKPLVEVVPWWTPVWAQRLLLRAMLRVIVGRYEAYGLPKPDHRIFEKHPTLNSELLHYIRHGRIKPRPDIRRFDGRAVEFVDGSRQEFDMVVAATGFHVSFPFLPKDLVPVQGGIAFLYAGCVLPTVKNLYVIGTGQARYGFGPLLTPAAELVAAMIQLQEKMELPIGLVMKESGAPLPTTHLVDPHDALRKMKLAKRFLLPRLLRKEKKLRNKMAVPAPPECVRVIRSKAQVFY